MFLNKYVMRCAIWCHFYNLKNVKNTHGGVLKVTLIHGCYSRFSNCTNGTNCAKHHIWLVLLSIFCKSLLTCKYHKHHTKRFNEQQKLFEQKTYFSDTFFTRNQFRTNYSSGAKFISNF